MRFKEHRKAGTITMDEMAVLRHLSKTGWSNLPDIASDMEWDVMQVRGALIELMRNGLVKEDWIPNEGYVYDVREPSEQAYRYWTKYWTG
jgi:predicted transcriptional regulator